MQSASPTAFPPGLEFPELKHPELKLLFEQDIRLPAAEIELLLALPETTLVEDLLAILGFAEAWESPFRAAGHSTTPILPADRCFILHALNLLAELRPASAFPALRRFVLLPQETLSFWLGKFLNESLWEMLYHFVRDDFSKLGPLIREPELCLSGRIAVLDCVAQVAWKHPIKRPEVFGWYKELFGDVLEGKVALGGEALGWAVRNVVDLRARNLMPEVRRVYAEMELEIGAAGELEKVEREMEWPVKSWAMRQVYDMRERYAYMVATLYPSTPEEQDTAVKMHRVKPPKPGKGQLRVMGRKKTPLRKGVKVGRNDPCPCGSGKKYKKCCG